MRYPETPSEKQMLRTFKRDRTIHTISLAVAALFLLADLAVLVYLIIYLIPANK